MRTSERLLLYVMAFTLGCSLVFGGGSGKDRGDGPTTSQRANSASTFEQGRARSRREKMWEKAAPPFTPSTGGGKRLRSLELVDAAGRSRIQLKVDDDGQARFLILDGSGQPMVSISAGDTGGAEISVRNEQARARLYVQPDGALALTLEKNDGASAQMAISGIGDAVIGVVAKNRASEAVFRTDISGAVEIAMHKADTPGGPSMSILPNGQMGISVKGTDGVTGPVMQIFEDGLAEIAIPGSDGASGPSMLLMPRGVSVISLRRAGGKLGASMVMASDGSAVVATSAGEGRGEASLRVDAAGTPRFEITDPKDGRRRQLDPKSD